jgi:hypothetical protein
MEQIHETEELRQAAGDRRQRTDYINIYFLPDASSRLPVAFINISIFHLICYICTSNEVFIFLIKSNISSVELKSGIN